MFEDRGRKSTTDQRLIDEQKRENQKFRETIAEIITENLELKKRLEITGGRHEILIS